MLRRSEGRGSDTSLIECVFDPIKCVNNFSVHWKEVPSLGCPTWLLPRGGQQGYLTQIYVCELVSSIAKIILFSDCSSMVADIPLETSFVCFTDYTGFQVMCVHPRADDSLFCRSRCYFTGWQFTTSSKSHIPLARRPRMCPRIFTRRKNFNLNKGYCNIFIQLGTQCLDGRRDHKAIDIHNPKPLR